MIFVVIMLIYLVIILLIIWFVFINFNIMYFLIKIRISSLKLILVFFFDSLYFGVDLDCSYFGNLDSDLDKFCLISSSR